MAPVALTNEDVARTLERIAELLELQSENPYRVHAYRRAAQTIRAHPSPVAALVNERGVEALKDDGIGQALGGLLVELVATGSLRMLERLEKEVPPEARLARLAGIGPGLAKRVHDTLQIETLEDLEVAAHDGSLELVPGFGKRRAESIRQQLAGLLGRRGTGKARAAPGEDELPHFPPVAMLLDVDREYLEKAASGELTLIAPRRFNPSHEAWLPVLHATRDDVNFTALFSNTARAHQLATTHDWVVLYFNHDGAERQVTVVTETHGPLEGRRVVRGREAECQQHYAAEGSLAPKRAAVRAVEESHVHG